ncbi:unnamed protein product (macronuclear) [Paramecium tetraurelia]|uniref:C2H2-type domain-containing protein n=1 Tax=Paramecium tetraurelia TaxID=5888 RepID=A0CZ87_PARTE|nr:uncharacterized protein GSPATT00011677001 [Paramecium tetraurelia]CAK76104.1 unnamed protein product [Paramecium tetraurelia]|eukprot:XP_001443501.1 hypothetical protein (macronuclear) [Paramecium tetraurelia strain d4-2]
MQDKSNTNSSVQESYSPQKPAEGGEKKKRTRTRKYSDAQREHKCECGKSYLSYPALYTHMKQKHNGQSLKNLDEQRLESTFSESQTQDIFATLANALGKEEDKSQTSFNNEDMYDLINWELQLQMMETDNKLIKLDYYRELMKPTQPADITTPQDAFIRFIHELKGVLSYEQMKLIFLFVYSFRKLLIDYPDCPTSGLVEKANQLICSQLDKVLQSIQQLSNRNYIVHLCRVPNLREVMIKIVLGFCNWLYARHLTDDKLLLKSDSD